MSRLVLAFYFTSLVLLPWTWFPPFPWVHEHAQWSDLVFGLTALLWVIEQHRTRQSLGLRPAHVAIALYFLLALLSLLFAAPAIGSGAAKLLGVAELCALALITSDLASRPGVSLRITRAIVISSIATATAAIAGLLLFYVGAPTRLIGIYGELEPSNWYARVQAGTYNPNLLASFCIFASAVVARRNIELPRWIRRITLAALWVTVFLTFSRGIIGFILAAAIRNAYTRGRKRLAAAAAVLAVTILISATLGKPYLDPSHPLETRLAWGHSSRLQAITSSLSTLVAHPLFGSGLGTSPGTYRGVPFDAHCTPLNIAATLGLPALIAFSAIIAIAWRKRKFPTDLAIWGGLAGLVLDGLAQDVEDFRHVWVMIGLAFAASVNKNSSASATQQDDHQAKTGT